MSGPSTLTLQDIADLARVRRPVVSMWRRREQVGGETIPFPAPVDSRGRVEHFDRDEVVAWIEQTGRGSNPQFALDAVAAAVPDDADLDDLTALLCLEAAAGVELGGLTADDLVDLADEVDPDDQLLFTEVERLAPRAGALALYVDDLLAVAFSPADALDRLAGGRLGRTSRDQGFTADGVNVLRVVTTALRTHLGDDEASLVDASAGDSGLALQIAAAWPEGTTQVLAIPGDSPAARRQRRGARLRGLEVATRPTGGAVVVLPVMAYGPLEAMEAIDELQLALPAERVAVVVGPASVLCDVPDDPRVEQVRDSVVRTGTLRFAARLPRGLWAPAPRQALGLWIFGAQTARRLEDRSVALADLSDRALSDTAVSDDLATDAVASLGALSAHAFRFARVVRTSRVIASREVVPQGLRPQALKAPTAAERQVRIDDLLATLGSGLPAPRIDPRSASATEPAGSATLDELIDRGALRLRRGARLDRTLARPQGAVRIVDPVAGVAREGFDPVELELHHPRAMRTEPGDVVFAVTPRPAAVVDDTGGGVVAFPARILRARPDAPVGSRALAYAINHQPENAREWRSWRVPLAPRAERGSLESALADLDRLRTELSRRLEASTDLADALIDAVAAGAVTLGPNNRTGD